MEQKEEHAKRVVRLWFMAFPYREVLVYKALTITQNEEHAGFLLSLVAYPEASGATAGRPVVTRIVIPPVAVMSPVFRVGFDGTPVAIREPLATRFCFFLGRLHGRITRRRVS
jgi:hypothetical protein